MGGNIGEPTFDERSMTPEGRVEIQKEVLSKINQNRVHTKGDEPLTGVEKSIIYTLYRYANASGKLGEILTENEDESVIEILAGMYSLLEKVNAHEPADAFEGMIFSNIKDHLSGGH